MKSAKYSSLPFFVELLVNIVIFILCTTILVVLFTKTIFVSKQTRIENLAAAEMYAVAEIIATEGVAGLPVIAQEGEEVYWLRYDENWHLTESSPTYTLRISLVAIQKNAGTLTNLFVIAYSVASNEELYHFNIEFYTPYGRSELR